MASFSERYGHVPALGVQRGNINTRLRTAIWNIIHTAFEVMHQGDREWHQDRALGKVRLVWGEFFGGPIDKCTYAPLGMEGVRDAYFKLPWFRVYDLVEFLVSHWDIPPLAFNQVFEREHSAYRISDDNEVIEVTDENQLGAINKAMEETSQLTEVRKHLAEAQECYAQRDEGGYRNCIKESICAVESLAKLIVNEPHSTLGAVLPNLGKVVKIHAHQIDAWRDIWKYTSDRPGVRHGGPDDEPVTSEEALHMLVTCSSFVTYLLERAANANIKLA